MDPLTMVITWGVAFPLGAFYGAWAYKRALIRLIKKIEEGDARQTRDEELRRDYGA